MRSVTQMMLEVKRDPCAYPKYGGKRGSKITGRPVNDTNYDAIVEHSKILMASGIVTMTFSPLTVLGVYAFLPFVVVANNYTMSSLAWFPLQKRIMVEFIGDLTDSLTRQESVRSLPTVSNFSGKTTSDTGKTTNATTTTNFAYSDKTNQNETGVPGAQTNTENTDFTNYADYTDYTANTDYTDYTANTDYTDYTNFTENK